MGNNILISKYLTQPVVRQRNSITLNNWAAYIAELAIPEAPDDAWVEQRIQAENVSLRLDQMVTQTIGYFAQNQITQTNIQQFINENNDDATEVALASQNDSILAAFAPQWCATTVSQPQVDAWRANNLNAPAPAPGGKK